jgi:hypothetical protein
LSTIRQGTPIPLHLRLEAARAIQAEASTSGTATWRSLQRSHASRDTPTCPERSRRTSLRALRRRDTVFAVKRRDRRPGSLPGAGSTPNLQGLSTSSRHGESTVRTWRPVLLHSTVIVRNLVMGTGGKRSTCVIYSQCAWPAVTSTETDRSPGLADQDNAAAGFWRQAEDPG